MPDPVPAVIPKKVGIFLRIGKWIKNRVAPDPASEPEKVNTSEIGKSISNAFVLGGPIGFTLGVCLVFATGLSWFFPISGSTAAAVLCWLIGELWKRRGDGPATS